jgi:hypothetical protein
MAFISRRRVLRCDGSLRRCNTFSYSARETRRVDTTKRRAFADSGPRGKSRAQPALPLVPRG